MRADSLALGTRRENTRRTPNRKGLFFARSRSSSGVVPNCRLTVVASNKMVRTTSRPGIPATPYRRTAMGLATRRVEVMGEFYGVEIVALPGPFPCASSVFQSRAAPELGRSAAQPVTVTRGELPRKIDMCPVDYKTESPSHLNPHMRFAAASHSLSLRMASRFEKVLSEAVSKETRAGTWRSVLRP
jgi:hypothetical protein